MPKPLPVRNKLRSRAHERGIVDTLKRAGYKAHRTYGSSGASEGKPADVDVVLEPCEMFPDGLWYQAYLTVKLAKKYLIPDHLEGVIFKQTHGKQQIMLTFDRYLALLQTERSSEHVHNVQEVPQEESQESR